MCIFVYDRQIFYVLVLGMKDIVDRRFQVDRADEKLLQLINQREVVLYRGAFVKVNPEVLAVDDAFRILPFYKVCNLSFQFFASDVFDCLEKRSVLNAS